VFLVAAPRLSLFEDVPLMPSFLQGLSRTDLGPLVATASSLSASMHTRNQDLSKVNS